MRLNIPWRRTSCRVFLAPSLIALACSGISEHRDHREPTEASGPELTLSLSPHEIAPDEELQLSLTLTNAKAGQVEGFLHFPRTIRLNHAETNEDWLLRDATIHDTCSAEDRFILENRQHLVRSFTRPIPDLPRGTYVVIAEVTLAKCDLAGAKPRLRWIVRSAPTSLRIRCHE